MPTNSPKNKPSNNKLSNNKLSNNKPSNNKLSNKHKKQPTSRSSGKPMTHHKTRKNTKKNNRKKNNRKTIVLMATVVVLVVIIATALVVYASVFAPTTRAGKMLVVDKGDTYQSLLINNPWQTHPLAIPQVGKLYLRFVSGHLQTGSYRIANQASLYEVVNALQAGGDTAMIKVQIIEGKTIKDLYHRLKTTEGIQLTLLSPLDDETYTWEQVHADDKKVAQALGLTDKSSLEGLFAPDTYYFAKGVSDKAILQNLYERQSQRLAQAWQERSDNLPYQSAYELLIMASIVEKETGLVEERGKVAGVFVNRLNKKMRLQTDPTIIYGLFDRYDGKIYRVNIDEKTAYNTYQIDGLPPTPIALPSYQALQAAAHPDSTPYLYFVATGKGGHNFSTTLDEHNQAVAAYRQVIASQNKK